MAQPEFQGGPLRVASAASVAEAAQRTEQEEKEKAILDQQSAEVRGLVGYLLGVWEQNKSHKEDEGIQQQMIDNLRSRDSEYDPTKLQKILEAGGADVFMGLTNVKCSHGESWLADIFSSSDKSWGIDPTPDPEPTRPLVQKTLEMTAQRLRDFLVQQGAEVDIEDLPAVLEEMRPEAEESLKIELDKRTLKMETKIHDQMVEGGWDDAFEDFLSDVVTLKAGIIKGPIPRQYQRIEWQIDEATGKANRVVVDKVRPEYERVSPLDIYPSPGATCINDGSLIERVKLSRSDLVALKEEPGYDADAIDEVLESFDTVANDSTVKDSLDSDRDDLEDKDTDKVMYRDYVDALEFWCPVQGQKLIEHGVEKMPGFKDIKIQPLEEYEVNAIVVNSTLIFVNKNEDELGRRPYSKTGWRKVPGSFWYKGVPELMEDLQRICNAAVRALVYNMSLASGPQSEVDTDRLAPGEDIENVYPGKVWQTVNRNNQSIPAVRFFQPNSNAEQLFRVYENFARLADDYTGIPAYAFGSDKVAGAGRTSSGLSMLMSSAAKGIKRVILGIDKDIFKPTVRRQFDYNMQFDPDPDIRGDIEIVTTGAVAVMVKEQMAERRMQFLTATLNPEDAILMGLEGRGNVLREVASALEMEGTQIVKGPDEVRDMANEREQAQTQAQEAQAAQTQMEAELKLQALQLDLQVKQMDMESKRLDNQVKLAELEIERQKLALEAAKAESEAAARETQTDAQAAKDYASVAESAVSQLDTLTGGEDALDQAEEEVFREENAAAGI